MQLLHNPSNAELVLFKSGAATIYIDPLRLLLVIKRDSSLYYAISLLSAADSPDIFDETTTVPVLEKITREENGFLIEVSLTSSLWQKKKHFYRVGPETVEFWIELEGWGVLDRVYFSRGTLNGRELASLPGFTRVFSPQANFIEKEIFHSSEYSSMGVGNDEAASQSFWGYSLHGAPLCFGFHNYDCGSAIMAGILVKAGNYSFDKIEINHANARIKAAHDSIIGTQSLSMAYNGNVKIDGRWRSPTLWISHAENIWSGLNDYLIRLNYFGGTVARKIPYEPWTFQPVFCTWHEQVALSLQYSRETNLSFQETESGVNTFSFCTQKNCERWLGTLVKKGLKPGVFIIDAKWQIQNGDPVVDTEKFPDLRGFVEKLHSQGIRVILWFNGWDAEGLPEDECLRTASRRLAPDPTLPAYRARARQFMRRLLSSEEGCYNADGIKLDGLTTTPNGPGIVTHGGLTGFELGRSLIELLHREGHAVKKDCVIGTYGASPYFADLCDMARTGDLYTVRGDPIGTNRFRARMQRLVMPEVAIDSDGAQRFNIVLSAEEVVESTPHESCPCLYEAEHLIQRRGFCIARFSALDDDHYATIRKVWNRRIRSATGVTDC